MEECKISQQSRIPVIYIEPSAVYFHAYNHVGDLACETLGKEVASLHCSLYVRHSFDPWRSFVFLNITCPPVGLQEEVHILSSLKSPSDQGKGYEYHTKLNAAEPCLAIALYPAQIPLQLNELRIFFSMVSILHERATCRLCLTTFCQGCHVFFDKEKPLIQCDFCSFSFCDNQCSTLFLGRQVPRFPGTRSSSETPPPRAAIMCLKGGHSGFEDRHLIRYWIRHLPFPKDVGNLVMQFLVKEARVEPLVPHTGFCNVCSA